MFDFPNNSEIKSHREQFRGKILGSFRTEADNAASATLVKGLSVEEFQKQYSEDKFDIYSFESLNRAKDDLTKGGQATDLESLIADKQPVVVQNGGIKKLFYVSEKKAAV